MPPHQRLGCFRPAITSIWSQSGEAFLRTVPSLAGLGNFPVIFWCINRTFSVRPKSVFPAKVLLSVRNPVGNSQLSDQERLLSLNTSADLATFLVSIIANARIQFSVVVVSKTLAEPFFGACSSSHSLAHLCDGLSDQVQKTTHYPDALLAISLLLSSPTP